MIASGSGPQDWDHSRLGDPLAWPEPTLVLVKGLFVEPHRHGNVAAVFGVMAATQNHTYRVLTSWPDRVSGWLKWVELERTRWENIKPSLFCIQATSNRLHRSGLSEVRNDFLDKVSAVPFPSWPLPNVEWSDGAAVS